MNMNVSGSEKFAFVGIVDPDVSAAGAHNSTSIDMSKFESATALILMGDLGSSATVDAVVKSGAVDGTFANTVVTATQATQAGTDASNKQIVLDWRGEDLTTGDRYCRVEVTVAVASCDLAAVIVGHNGRFDPASDNDSSTVLEIKNAKDE